MKKSTWKLFVAAEAALREKVKKKNYKYEEVETVWYSARMYSWKAQKQEKGKTRGERKGKLKNLYMWIVYSLNLIQLQTISNVELYI